MEKLNFLLNEKLSHNLKKMQINAALEKKIKANWETFFGKLAGELKFSHIKSNVVYFMSKNPLWNTEIQFYKKQILEKMNNEFKRAKILDLRTTPYKEDIVEEKVKITAETLEEKIKEQNKIKRDKGYIPCSSCGRYLPQDKECLFC